jgi:multidrug resistance protein, MATE family
MQASFPTRTMQNQTPEISAANVAQSTWGMLRQLLFLALPSMAGTISLALMQFVDGWMVSMLDRQNPQDAVNLAATFNGGIAAAVPMMFFVGLSGAISTLVSQASGRKLDDEPARYAWQGIWLALLSCAVFWPAIFLVRPGFIFAGHHEPLLSAETLFMSYMLLSVPISAAGTVLNNFFLGLHRPIHQFTAGAAGNVINLILDWLLIFGHYGFPRLGLLGAALATLTGSLASLLVLASVFVSRNYRGQTLLTSAMRPDLGRLWKLLRIGVPAGTQSAADILCWTVFTLFWIDSFGRDAAEAQSAAMRYVTLSFMPAVGMGMAVSAMVGKRLGAGDLVGARRAAAWGFRISMLYMGLCGLAFWLLRRPLSEFLLGDPEQIDIACKLLIFAAIFQIFDAMNVVFISALRGAGDTFVPTLVTTLLAWGVCVAGGGATVWLWPQWGVSGPWTMATAYLCLSGVWNYWRWKQERWRGLDVLAAKLKVTIEPTS